MYCMYLESKAVTSHYCKLLLELMHILYLSRHEKLSIANKTCALSLKCTHTILVSRPDSCVYVNVEVINTRYRYGTLTEYAQDIIFYL